MKKVSGTYNALYILRGALYMFHKQSFIYFETMLSIEENMKQISINRKQAQAIWQAHHRVATTTRYSTWAKKGGR